MFDALLLLAYSVVVFPIRGLDPPVLRHGSGDIRAICGRRREDAEYAPGVKCKPL